MVLQSELEEPHQVLLEAGGLDLEVLLTLLEVLDPEDVVPVVPVVFEEIRGANDDPEEVLELEEVELDVEGPVDVDLLGVLGIETADAFGGENHLQIFALVL